MSEGVQYLFQAKFLVPVKLQGLPSRNQMFYTECKARQQPYLSFQYYEINGGH